MIDFFCPVTGLKVFSRPDWINKSVSESFSVSFYVIGCSIIYSAAVGKADLKGAVNALALSEEIAKHVAGGKGPYIKIEDYAAVNGTTHEARRYYAKSMDANRRCKALIFCNLSPALSIAVKIGSRLNNSQEIHSVKHYSDAVELALNISEKQHPGTNQFVFGRKICFDDSRGSLTPIEVRSNDDWEVRTPEYSNRSVLVDGCIMHSTSVGRPEPEHIPLIDRMRSMCREALPEGSGIEYIVIDCTHTRGENHRVRMKLMESLKEWNRRFPLSAYILYGAAASVRAAVFLKRPFLPFKVGIAHDLNHAFRLIRKDRLRDSSAGDPIREEIEITDSMDENVEQLLAYMGGINWEHEGIDYEVEVSENHPFYLVFQSLKLIKDELDDLFAERKHSEEELRKSEEKYRLLAEDMADVVWTANMELQVTYVSPSVEKVLGFTPEERKKQTLQETVTPASFRRIIELFQEEMRRGETQAADPDRSITFEVEYFRKDGTTVWMENSVKAIRDPPGTMVGIHGVSRDISERKQAEKERDRLETQLRQAQKMEAIGTLAGGIAHDFNNILGGIIGYTELALMDVSRGLPNKDRLEEILKSGL